MAMVVVDDSCLKQADSQPMSCDLVWGLAALGAALHSPDEPSELSQWPGHGDSTINIVLVIIILLLEPRISSEDTTQSTTALWPVSNYTEFQSCFGCHWWCAFYVCLNGTYGRDGVVRRRHVGAVCGRNERRCRWSRCGSVCRRRQPRSGGLHRLFWLDPNGVFRIYCGFIVWWPHRCTRRPVHRLFWTIRGSGRLRC